PGDGSAPARQRLAFQLVERPPYLVVPQPSDSADARDRLLPRSTTGRRRACPTADVADRAEAAARHPGRIGPATEHGHQEAACADEQHKRSDYDERRGFVHAPRSGGLRRTRCRCQAIFSTARRRQALGSALPTATYNVRHGEPGGAAQAGTCVLRGRPPYAIDAWRHLRLPPL